MNTRLKPPLGIIPKWLWLELLEVPRPSDIEKKERRLELLKAVERCRQAGRREDPLWLHELSQY